MWRGKSFCSAASISAPATGSRWELREAVEDAGFKDVRAYLQSGNVVLTSTAKPESVARKCERVIMEFCLEIAVVVRTRDELAKVVKRNPLGNVASDPKRYQVSFLSAKLDEKVVRELEAAADELEQVVVARREVYAWLPKTIARSRLWTQLAGKNLGVTATSRNWATVDALLRMADEWRWFRPVCRRYPETAGCLRTGGQVRERVCRRKSQIRHCLRLTPSGVRHRSPQSWCGTATSSPKS